MNKLILVCCAFFFLLATATTAQDESLDGLSRELKDRVETQRIAFITNRLELSPEEAQSFWPIYNQYKAEEKMLSEKNKLPRRLANLSDQEIEKHILAGFEIQEEKIALRKKFFYQLKEVLPVRKIGMLQHAEKAFKRKVLKAIKNKKRRRDRNN